MKQRLALLLALASVGFHVYLTYHFYGLQFGMVGDESICNLSTTFNCDAVSASQYSSFLGIPLALYGAITNFALAGLLMGWMIRWTDSPARTGRTALILASFIALASVAMGAVSTLFLNTYCIFCIALYALSFGQLELIRRAQEPDADPIIDTFKNITTAGRTLLILAVAIPAFSFLIHKMFVSRYGAGALDQMVKAAVLDWQAAPQVQLTVPPTISVGPADAKFSIAEFADFRCGHCKAATPAIKAFVGSRPDVQFNFYVFPLDGACNEAMQSADGISCMLAKSVYCAEKIAQKGIGMKLAVFAAQDTINQSGSLEVAKTEVKTASDSQGLDHAALLQCIDASETDTAIRAQAKLGKDIGVQGTPTFFINGRKLSRGQLIPVLEAAYKTVK